MTPDFTLYLMAGEQIMWQGESHKEGPAADPKNSRGTRFFGIMWTFLTSMMFIPMIFFTPDLLGTAKIVSVFMAVIFIGIGIAFICYSFHYKHEYYCITDRRFLVMDDKNRLSIHELFHIRTAELTGITGNYGSILMITDIVHRHRSNGHTHTTRERWGMRGVENPSECYRILTSVLMLNEEEKINQTNFR